MSIAVDLQPLPQFDRAQEFGRLDQSPTARAGSPDSPIMPLMIASGSRATGAGGCR
jgi:hypothetical protein